MLTVLLPYFNPERYFNANRLYLFHVQIHKFEAVSYESVDVLVVSQSWWNRTILLINAQINYTLPFLRKVYEAKNSDFINIENPVYGPGKTLLCFISEGVVMVDNSDSFISLPIFHSYNLRTCPSNYFNQFLQSCCSIEILDDIINLNIVGLCGISYGIYWNTQINWFSSYNTSRIYEIIEALIRKYLSRTCIFTPMKYNIASTSTA